MITRRNNGLRKGARGFTLLELLVVISIIGFVTTVVVFAIQSSKKKAVDTVTKRTLSDVRTMVAQQSPTEPQRAFDTGTPAKEAVDTLARNLGYGPEDNGTDYQYHADPTGYIAAFPLLADTSEYWCIDGEGVSRGTDGLLTPNTTVNCDNTDRDPHASTTIPDLTITGPSTLTFSGVGSTRTLPLVINETNGGATTGAINIRIVHSGTSLALQNTQDWTIAPESPGILLLTSRPGFTIGANQGHTINLLLTKTTPIENFILARITDPFAGETNQANNLYVGTLIPQ
ncbi:MAG: prepilin-type N-terminal cleavage/methylation domain-containing protein [Candidatus Pacebacteria bacterium]|nr:prepilin-type N-terminal cleavage/methylation domain-containing protein [Candidatus Paceibacterota bacterium]MBP9701045.1 prepilin-type N-terminal cleavage/methylation domain-containing protein [Candidatus Paceibacterota bacterium]